MKKYAWFLVVFSVGALLSAAYAWSGSILDTKHNLSVSGPGPVKSITEEEVCVFCHTPHQARRDIPYLWNREDSSVTFTTYKSSTLYAVVGQPSGGSKLCLSCHDGTIALGSVLSSPQEIPFVGGIRFMPEGLSKLGTDISDDHPVSFLYDAALAASNGELVSPALLTGNVKLDQSGLLQCTSCHDPHDDVYGKFLVQSNSYSGLCTSCHDLTDWLSSSHATSTSIWNGMGGDPWPHTTYASVDENACENCHRPHNAGGHARLLINPIEEDNCLVCHNGNVATKNIESELIKQYRHPVQDYNGVHDAAEDFAQPVSTHVECVDCHNPHRSGTGAASAPDVPGSMRGVSGISAGGTKIDQALYLYEVCVKCHGDNNAVSFVDISRQNQQLNTRLEFDVANPSYHPVMGVGQNPDVPSLLPPYNTGSIIYCTDCHNSESSPANGGAGPNGPHGSLHKYILERNYTTTDNATESSYEYAMCYKCHDRNKILGDASGFTHSVHVGTAKAPCSACHDPHGISSTQGNAVNNTNLINFDINIVTPDSNGQLFFEDRGVFQGACYLSCHGHNHVPATYGGM